MFESAPLMPHAVCWAAAPHLIWTMVITNLITFLSYVTLCCTLLYLTRKTRRVIARDWAFFAVGFALFIVACGSTHLLEVITTWTPIFWVDAATNVVTAVLSALVAVMLIRRAGVIAFSINDYAARLGNSETERHHMESSLLDAQKLSEWSRVSTAVSHEIAQPLELIQSTLYLIRTTESVPPSIVELAQTAADEAMRVLTISRNSLSFFRHSATPEPTDLHAAAESVRFLLSPTFSPGSVGIDILTTGDVRVDAFPGETRQALLNLIRNACEATPRGGANITVSLTGHSSHVEIIVADHGTGISEDAMQNLFQFGRSTKGEQGNGLGLWTVKHIIDKHRGSITVQSQPGQGTRFTLLWPRRFALAALPGAVTHAHA